MIIMTISNMSTSYFHKKIISLFWGLFNDKTHVRRRYSTRVVVIILYLVAKLRLMNTIREISVLLQSVKRGYLYLLWEKFWVLKNGKVSVRRTIENWATRRDLPNQLLAEFDNKFSPNNKYSDIPPDFLNCSCFKFCWN